MKKLMIILGCAAVFSFSGCDRFTPDFGDFDYTAVYFPHQYPIRTLSLGEDYVDNSLDRELKFNIGVGIGGLRENTQSWQVGYIQDPALLDKIRQVSGDTLLPMPTEYFSMANNSEFTIPAGSFSGLIQVQMSQNFLQDPLAWGEGGLYVIPLRITSTNADSILFGRATTDSPDRRIPSDYDPDAQPRDFTLFAVKYVNEYHGSYLHRGIDIGYDNQGAPVDTAVYSQRYVVDDQIWRLATKGRNVVHTNGISQLVTEGSMIYSMALSVDNGGNINVAPVEGSVFQIQNGSGRFQADGDAWGGESRDAIYLQYEYLDASDIRHEVRDTLVFRDRGITFETIDYELVD